VTDAIGRDLKTVFKECDEPAYEYDSQEGSIFIFQMTIPGKGHEDIGNGKQQDCFHGVSYGLGQPAWQRTSEIVGFSMRMRRAKLKRRMDTIAIFGGDQWQRSMSATHRLAGREE
jgi:hypothetical protein